MANITDKRLIRRDKYKKRKKWEKFRNFEGIPIGDMHVLTNLNQHMLMLLNGKEGEMIKLEGIC